MEGPLPNRPVCLKLFHQDTGAYLFSFARDEGHQEGMYFFYQGVTKALRNPTSHGKFEADRVEALQILGFVDYLLGLEKEAKERAESGGEAGGI